MLVYYHTYNIKDLNSRTYKHLPKKAKNPSRKKYFMKNSGFT